MTPQSARSSKALCKKETLAPGGTSFYMQLPGVKLSSVVMCMAGIIDESATWRTCGKDKSL